MSETDLRVRHGGTMKVTDKAWAVWFREDGKLDGAWHCWIKTVGRTRQLSIIYAVKRYFGSMSDWHEERRQGLVACRRTTLTATLPE